MNPLKRVHFAEEPPKRQRIENIPSLSGRSIATVSAELALDEKLTGVFKVIRAYGAVYEGEIVDGLAHGRGRISNQSGVVRHEGEYRKGQFNGYGAGDFHGYSYYGDYRNDQVDGYGAIYNEEGELEWDGFWVQGCKYVGELKNRKPNGTGTTYDLRGNKIYEGEWKDGVPHGQGTRYLPGGKRPSFIGHFKNGMRDGYGVHYWEHIDEIRAEGTWKDDRWHGEMTYTSIDGTKTYHGFYENSVEV